MAIDTQKSVESPLDAGIIMILLLMLTGSLAVLAFVTVPHDNLPVFIALASNGIVAPIVAYVSFRWGSSKGSQAKDETIASMAKESNNP